MTGVGDGPGGNRETSKRHALAGGRSYRDQSRQDLLELRGAATNTGFCECPGWLIVTIEQKGETLKRQEHMMNTSGDGFSISENGARRLVGPTDEQEWADRESLIRADYDKCHPGETFDDLKYRARFSKEDQGLLSEWMTLAARRAAERRTTEAVGFPHAA